MFSGQEEQVVEFSVLYVFSGQLVQWVVFQCSPAAQLQAVLPCITSLPLGQLRQSGEC